MQIDLIKKELKLYLIDIENFATTIKDNNFEDDSVKEILDNAKKLYEIINLIQNTYKNKDILNASELSNLILTNLKELKCKEQYVFEKTDLIVRIFLISESISELSPN